MGNTKIRADEQIGLGRPTDSTFDDGLFKDADWPDTMPVVDAIDDINEVLSALAPPTPGGLLELQAYGMFTGTSKGRSGQLAFGESHAVSPSHFYADDVSSGPDTLSSCDLTNVPFQGSFNRGAIGNDFRSGIFPGGYNVRISFNQSVEAASPYYDAYAFSPGRGTITVRFNGSDVTWNNVIDLSAEDGTIYRTSTSPANLTFQISPIHYVNNVMGSPFSTVLANFTYRHGNYSSSSYLGIQINASAMRAGWNWMRITHTIGTTIVNSYYVDWVIDNSTSTITMSETFAMPSPVPTVIQISGVKYYNGGTLNYSTGTISNMYNVTYDKSVTFATLTGTGSINTGTYLTAPAKYTVPEPASYTSTVSISNQAYTFKSNVAFISLAAPYGAGETAALKAGCVITTPGKVNYTHNSSGAEISGLCVHNLTSAATALFEDFANDSVLYRINSTASWTDIDLPSGGSVWNNEASLLPTNPGYDDGLQVTNGCLVYPIKDYRNALEGGTLTNAPTGNVNYSTCSGTRYYYRTFTSATATSSFTFVFTGDATFVQETEADFSGKDVKVSILLPTQTGWMDCVKDFVTGQYTDGSGCFLSEYGSEHIIGGTWKITVGVKTTANSGNRIYMRIAMPERGSAYINQITVTWSAS